MLTDFDPLADHHTPYTFLCLLIYYIVNCCYPGKILVILHFYFYFISPAKRTILFSQVTAFDNRNGSKHLMEKKLTKANLEVTFQQASNHLHFCLFCYQVNINFFGICSIGILFGTWTRYSSTLFKIRTNTKRGKSLTKISLHI